VRSGLVLKLTAKWEFEWFSPSMRTFNSVLLIVDISGSHWSILTENNGWESPNTGLFILMILKLKWFIYVNSKYKIQLTFAHLQKLWCSD
jgi:hypothetical protein